MTIQSCCHEPDQTTLVMVMRATRQKLMDSTRGTVTEALKKEERHSCGGISSGLKVSQEQQTCNLRGPKIPSKSKIKKATKARNDKKDYISLQSSNIFLFIIIDVH